MERKRFEKGFAMTKQQAALDAINQIWNFHASPHTRSREDFQAHVQTIRDFITQAQAVDADVMAIISENFPRKMPNGGGEMIVHVPATKFKRICDAARQSGAGLWDMGRTYTIAHDGFFGKIIGSYITKEGKEGVVMQQIGTRVVHVYGRKWLTITEPPTAAIEAAMKESGNG
jgi:hypothetical protein